MSIHPGHHVSRPTPCEIREVEALVAPLRREIARLGWTVAGSTAEGRRPSWVHTIGLLANHDHPEFVIVGHDELISEVVLGSLAMQVAFGARFSQGDQVELLGATYELGWVHPRHFQLDTFAMWEPLMEMHLHHFRPAALQVLPCSGSDGLPQRRSDLRHPRPIR